MRVNCRWKDKIGRYSEKLVKNLYPDFEKVKNPYVLGCILRNTRHWKSKENDLGLKIGSKFLQFSNLHHIETFDLLKYGINVNNNNFTKLAYSQWDKIGFMLSNDHISSLSYLIKDEENHSVFELLNKAKNSRWRNEKLEKRLNNDLVQSAEISLDSKTITIEMFDKKVVFYGLSYEYDSFSSIIELIESEKIKNIALPIQSNTSKKTEEELKIYLNEKLSDKQNNKLLEVQKLIISNTFGIKATNFPLSLILRRENKGVFFYMPSVSTIGTFFEDFSEVEKLVRICVLIDYCRVFNEINEKGCFLCSTYKNVIIPYQDQAIYSSPFLPKLLDFMGATLNHSISSTKGNFLVLCSERLLLDTIFSTINPSNIIETTTTKLSAENNMLLNIFYNNSK